MNSDSSHAAEPNAVATTLQPQPTTVPDAKRAGTMAPQRGGSHPMDNFATVDPTYRDIAYASLSPAQNLDLYLPADGSRPFPLVIMVHDLDNSPESRLVGAPIQNVPDVVRTTNPMNYITAEDPPFLIEHGTEDRIIPPAQSRNLAGALRAVIGEDNVTYVSLEGAGHGDPQFETSENLRKVISFLDKYLK